MQYTQIEKYLNNNKEKMLKEFWDNNKIPQSYNSKVEVFLKDRSIIALNDSQKENIRKFSRGKYEYLSRELKSLKANSNSYNEFISKAEGTFDKHTYWLKVEGDHVSKASRQIKQWDDINKKKGYKIKWLTSNDEKVRDEHRILDGFTKPPNDPFWQEQFPGQAPNCRCTYQLVKDDESQMSNEILTLTSPNSKGFNVNAGVTGVFFTNKHSYLK